MSLLSDLLAKAEEKKQPARVEPKRPSGRSLLGDLLAEAEAGEAARDPQRSQEPRSQQRRPRRPAQRRQRQQAPQGRPDGYARLFDKAMGVVTKQSEPRPSHVLKRVRELARFDRRLKAWVQENPAVVLMDARARLPGQPKTPLTKPPQRRKIEPVSVGLSGIVRPHSDELVNRPVAAEAFSGGGLFGCALWLEGVYVSELCEWDKWAVETLKTNLHEHTVSTDALTWNPTVPDGGLDMLCGGPPCTDFSPARDLGGGVNLVANSTRNLYPRVLEWIADTQPRVVMMENTGNVATSRVRGLRSSMVVQPPGDSSGNIRPFFRSWWKNLDRLGYEGVFWVLYAPDYGTPQNRTRAWVIAWPKGAPWGERLRSIPEPTFGHPASTAVASGERLPWVSAFDRLLSGCCGGYGLADCTAACYLEGACATCIDGAHYEQAPNSLGDQGRRSPSANVVRNMAGIFERSTGSTTLRIKSIGFIDLTPWNAFARRQSSPDFGDKVTDWLSKAITSNIRKDDMNAMMAPPDMPRKTWTKRYSPKEKDRREFVGSMVRLSARDAAKLQDVPNFWKFEGGKNAVFQQIGNGIPVNMGRTVVRTVLGALGYTVPIPGTESSDPFNGTWPLNVVDPCARFNAPVAFPGQRRLSIVDVLAAKDQQQQRQLARRRPVIDFQSLRRRMVDEQQARTRRAHFRSRGYDQPQEYDWGSIEWRPLDLLDHPPGFIDGYQAYAQVQGYMGADEDYLSLVNHMAMLYVEGLSSHGEPPLSIHQGAELFYRAMNGWHGRGTGELESVPGPDNDEYPFDPDLGFPAWSEFGD